MMEIDITTFLKNHEGMIEFSASRAEGYEGHETWQNALDYFGDNPYLMSSDDELNELDSHFSEYGAWDDEERATWTVRDYNALLLQFIAGDIRERQHYVDDDDMESYEENVGGRIWVDVDGSACYYIGN